MTEWPEEFRQVTCPHNRPLEKESTQIKKSTEIAHYSTISADLLGPPGLS